MELYLHRLKQRRPPYPKTPSMAEFAAQFPYEPTPDQKLVVIQSYKYLLSCIFKICKRGFLGILIYVSEMFIFLDSQDNPIQFLIIVEIMFAFTSIFICLEGIGSLSCSFNRIQHLPFPFLRFNIHYLITDGTTNSTNLSKLVLFFSVLPLYCAYKLDSHSRLLLMSRGI